MAQQQLTFTEVSALEILDSRGNPTLQVTVTTGDGGRYRAGVPSGASTGTREAVELRDGDPERYGGKGVTKAAAAVDGEIADALRGQRWTSLPDVDAALIDLDGTATKSRLGANALVGVSMAVARAFAGNGPLWQSLQPEGVLPRLPVPHFNVLNGGVHAPNDLDFQEFMIAPVGAPSLPEALRAGAAVYARLRALLAARGDATGLGDEGGFAPNIALPEDVLRLIVQAITEAGYEPGRDGVAIALDPASSEFSRDGSYHVAGEALSSDDMIARYEQMVTDFPVWSLEDGLAEGDWDGWAKLTTRLGDRVQLVGDDIFVTNPAIITAAVERRIGNSCLIKLNQIGTVTETLEAQRLCRDAGYTQMISHRSGETPDPFIADLAVATGTGQIKAGAPARGERVAKYNRLLEISAAAPDLPFGLAD
ncbi:phosphopyruvate hydratase [Tersicoccus phoenicis]|uniref:Enolase n=1 Tax=Tersicoccus phoenicis TaxID=554083 RepID=A0A1R1LN87_9MICC|nr:phosphopyruvate hydratase [Tersicoccus phoenicis]OMH29021.1 phosphopyruvate hydratase [Tersicoccus phoenicis]